MAATGKHHAALAIPPVPLDPRRAIAGGLAVIAVMLGGIGAWSATAPVATAVVAPGVVVVDGRRKQVQHLEGGIVQQIHVEDGVVVAQGQPVLRLDDARARATLGVVQTALDAARVLEIRLCAERDGVPLVFPQALAARGEEATLAAMMRAQSAVFEARRMAFQGQQGILRQRIGQYQEEIVGLVAQQESLEQQIALVEDELAGLRELLAKGFAPKTKVLALEREAARLRGARGERIAEIARARITISGTELEILQIERTRQESVTKEIRDVQAQIAELEERAGAAKATLDQILIRAPAAGVVVGLNAHTIGGVIKAGETLLEIVPSTQRLLIEAQVQPQDVDNIAVGMETDLRLTAFKQRTTPALVGRLNYVSADRLIDQRSGQPYYLARIEIVEGELARIAPQLLQAGMPVEVLIKRRSRTALDYLLQPVTDAMGRAWHED
jgi:HlyD family type I secretion membrane fusion protein